MQFSNLLVTKGEQRGRVREAIVVEDDIAVLEELKVERDGVGGVVGADGPSTYDVHSGCTRGGEVKAWSVTEIPYPQDTEKTSMSMLTVFTQNISFIGVNQ